jgi:hypothetical protein
MHKANVFFSEALNDLGIGHVFLDYEGDHFNKIQYRIREHVLPFFDQHLDHIIPGLMRKSASFLESTEYLVVNLDADGMLYVVPDGTKGINDSIIQNQIASYQALADMDVTIPMKDLVYGKYVVYGIDQVNEAVSIPVPFAIVENKLPPVLSIADDTVRAGQPLSIEMDRHGILFLVRRFTPTGKVRHKAYHLDSTICEHGMAAEFSTAELNPGIYWIYGLGEYDIFSEPMEIYVLDSTVNAPNRLSHSIRVYPNPCFDHLNIELNNADQCTIEIHCINGRTLCRREILQNGRIDLSPLSKGFYFITLRSKDYVTTRKIIKL